MLIMIFRSLQYAYVYTYIVCIYVYVYTHAIKLHGGFWATGERRVDHRELLLVDDEPQPGKASTALHPNRSLGPDYLKDWLTLQRAYGPYTTILLQPRYGIWLELDGSFGL